MEHPTFHVVVILFELHLPYSQSLKDKRMALRGIKDRLSKKFNLGIAEVGFQDSWQRAQIACTSVSCDRKILEKLRDQVETAIRESFDGELVYCDLEWL